MQAFIQALFVYSRFFPKIEFFLQSTKSVNLDPNIIGICISDTFFDFKAYFVHR